MTILSKSVHSLSLSYALKEWAVIVDALSQGRTILLLRKGGVREPKQKFTVPHRRIWLFPTYEHQKTELIQAPYHSLLSSPRHTQTVTLQSWADITTIYPIPSGAIAEQLLPYVVIDKNCLRDRWAWRPDKPLLALFLRVHRLEVVQTIPLTNAYRGCRSWLSLPEALSLMPSQPVLTSSDYGILHQRIEALIDPFKPHAGI